MNDRDCPYCNFSGTVHCGDVADKIRARGGEPGDCSNAKAYGRRSAGIDERAEFVRQEFGAKMSEGSRLWFLETGEPPYFLHDAWVAWQARAALSKPPVQNK